MLKYSHTNNERQDMTTTKNIISVEHTITFLAELNIDKIPANLLPALLSMSESDLKEMCIGATLNALEEARTLEIANAGNTWAEVKLA